MTDRTDEVAQLPEHGAERVSVLSRLLREAVQDALADGSLIMDMHPLDFYDARHNLHLSLQTIQSAHDAMVREHLRPKGDK